MKYEKIKEEEIAERIAKKKTFVINNEHADMIITDLLPGEYETLGRIFCDLINYNIYGDETLIETPGSGAEKAARKLLYSDSTHYIESYIAKSKINADNRTAGQEPTREEIIAYAEKKGYDINECTGWGIDQAKRDWCDKNGEKIKYWKKALDGYIRSINSKKLEDMANSIGKPKP